MVLNKEQKQKQKAMKSRFESFDEPGFASFEVVHDLVSDAFAKYSEGGNLKKCMRDLGNSILKAAKTAGK